MRLISTRCMIIVTLSVILTLPLPSILSAEPYPTFSLTSPAFKNGGAIPQPYTCSGLNKSPALAWRGVPSGTRSLALVVSDPDAPGGTFVHWVVYNIPPATDELPEGGSASIANGEVGVNGRGELGYTGPCPPPGKPHHYHFRLYALDQRLELKGDATAEQLEAAAKGHVLSSTETVGIFER
jgi:Raf kinase inhibitor-like YbhB/YbcL family protein